MANIKDVIEAFVLAKERGITPSTNVRLREVETKDGLLTQVIQTYMFSLPKKFGGETLIIQVTFTDSYGKPEIDYDLISLDKQLP